jgi:TATA-box binding protein (TBP) (component of TFIID and TFIIIB)
MTTSDCFYYQANRLFPEYPHQQRFQISMDPDLVPKPMHDAVVVNEVYTGQFAWKSSNEKWDKELPLAHIAITMHGCFSQEEFRSATMKAKDPNVTIHIYPDGVFIVCGARTADGVAIHIHRLRLRLLRVMKIQMFVHELQKSNVVVACTTGYLLCLDMIHSEQGDKSEYEPDSYPAVTYKPNYPAKAHPCFVFFQSGAFNVLGTSSLTQARRLTKEVGIERYRLDGPLAMTWMATRIGVLMTSERGIDAARMQRLLDHANYLMTLRNVRGMTIEAEEGKIENMML